MASRFVVRAALIADWGKVVTPHGMLFRVVGTYPNEEIISSADL